MNQDINIAEETISQRIFIIRGQKVMLDRDLAEMYGVKPFRLREQVKRNVERFPKNFMFQLNDEETDFMVSQFAIPSKKHLGGTLPFVFTEHGILMLANVLKNSQAISVSIAIIEVFVKMRDLLSQNKDLLLRLERLEKLVLNNDREIQSIFNLIRKLIHQNAEPRKKIGYTFHGEDDRIS